MELKNVILVLTRGAPDEGRSRVFVKIFWIASDRKPNKLAGMKRHIYFPVKVKHPG